MFPATYTLHSSELDTVSGVIFFGVYRIPPRAARTAGVISSVYAPSGSKRDTAFALHRTHRHTPRAALKRDTAFAMHPYPSVYAPSGPKTGYCIRDAPVPDGIRPERL